MSLLSIIQDHCKLHALSVPSSVTGSTDTQIIQLFAILKEILDEIVTESKFNVITQEAVFPLIAAEDQGLLSSKAIYGYQWAYPETFYDRTLGNPLYGPLNEVEWQQLQALPTPGIAYKFRIRQDHLLINPVPTVPFSTVAFEYASSWATKTSVGVLKAAPDMDTDIFVFPENILRKGMMFRWKQIKGLPYQADQTQYYNLLNNYVARDKVKRRINVSEGQPTDLKPGIMVPTNSWLN